LIVILARHGESELNLEGRVNGDPSVPAPLSERGREQARLLGVQLAHVEVDLCVHTRFGRTGETAELALDGRNVPLEVEPLLDDVKIGELEGASLAEYRAAKHELGRKRPYPGGESLDAAAVRYADAFERLGADEGRRVLVICHEVPIRYALNAAAGGNRLDGPPIHDVPNATPFLFEGDALTHAAARIRELAG
jgi:broad specificity phosphatase PhoE